MFLKTFQYSVSQASEQSIRERERELEKIHRRSRELMLSPRTLENVGTSFLPHGQENVGIKGRDFKKLHILLK